jgi:hypothetical protein
VEGRWCGCSRPSCCGCLKCCCLQHPSGSDGLFRLDRGSETDVWEEKAGALVPVRTQWLPPRGSRPGGFKLLTLRSRILDTELVD